LEYKNRGVIGSTFHLMGSLSAKFHYAWCTIELPSRRRRPRVTHQHSVRTRCATSRGFAGGLTLDDDSSFFHLGERVPIHWLGIGVAPPSWTRCDPSFPQVSD